MKNQRSTRCEFIFVTGALDGAKTYVFLGVAPGIRKIA
jgi:hypothetical protein